MSWGIGRNQSRFIEAHDGPSEAAIAHWTVCQCDEFGWFHRFFLYRARCSLLRFLRSGDHSAFIGVAGKPRRQIAVAAEPKTGSTLSFTSLSGMRSAIGLWYNTAAAADHLARNGFTSRASLDVGIPVPFAASANFRKSPKAKPAAVAQIPITSANPAIP